MDHQRPSVEEILARLPELAPYGREAARLRPERGEPGVGDSSIGGPLRWPADEPWPRCPVQEDGGPDGYPAMVPLAQVHARDVPGPWWPDGVDLLQVLWCPVEHWDPPAGQADVSPVVELRWRRSAELLGVAVAGPPEPSERYEEEYLPEPCVFSVERLTDFPYREELPPELRPALQQLVRDTDPEGKDVITRVAGWKLGGWPTWHLSSPGTPACRTCGDQTTLLLTIASDDVTDLVVGRWGDLRIFTCPTDHTHPFTADLH
ncbi:hypothetical protein CFP65_3069 [Kitasatospora sp. MMS16-BH015]|uniref:hypothetical protein n=1 Tax=Kitasatospora sp. MMS16-BH015 TaxID=2018025 RepID=UPI000CA19D3C|nr:hypothetical protein [Kitasatospora sp. MMS16-BH015]AUG77878.1 hypothetical protein CFP65_3069 [Kitasatospora sp. MMS16-BH015]